MLWWKWCCRRAAEYECVRHRKRRARRDFVGTVLIIAAILVLVCCLPAWIIAIMVCATLIGLAVIWFFA